MERRFIGQTARRFGLTPATLRYYESIGLLPTARRTPSGYRLYSEEAVRKLAFIIRAKSLGLTLEEIREIIHLHNSGTAPCDCTREIVRNKIREIDNKVAALTVFRDRLRRLLKARGRAPVDSICPIIEDDDA